MPFGTRGGILVKHVFPSDGEYTLTVTPIFGDNMSPTGFGSVPCEKLEILLDGERVQLMDWQGSRRFGASEANCGGPGSQAASPRGRGAAPGGAAGGRGRGGTLTARNEIPKMTVRVTTTAGPHMIGATFPQTNLAPVLDLDRHFMRDHAPDRSDAGIHVLPACRHAADRRAVQCGRGEGLAEPSPDLRAAGRQARRMKRPAPGRSSTGLATRAFRRPASAAEVQSLMEFYQAGRKDGDFDNGIEMALARILADPRLIYRIEAEPSNARPGQLYRISDLELASRCRSFSGARFPTRS